MQIIITFGEFLKMWTPESSLMGPGDYETRNRNELGIINGQHWESITFSPTLEHLTGAFVRSQILEYCNNLHIELTEDQIGLARKGVEYAVTSMIGDIVDSALDNLGIDREIVILDAWATPDQDAGFGDVYTDLADAIANSNLPEEALIKGYTVSGGADIQGLTEELFKDFYEDKSVILDIIRENFLEKFVNDLSEE